MNMPKLRFKADDGADFTEWESMLLGDLVYIQRGGSPRPIAKYLTTGYGINWIKIGDAPEFGHYITATKDKIIPAGKAKSREVHPGDLILSNSMSYGYPYILKIDGCIHDGWLLLRERNRPFDKVFLCEYLGSKSVQCQYERLAAGSAAKNLNIDLVSNVIIDLPSLQEQRKIADLLLAVDEVIEKQQAEITAWAQYKKGVAQKLFSQEVRFKADDGSDFPDWRSSTLGELGTFQKGAAMSKSDISESGTPMILYGELFTTYSEVTYNIERRTEKLVDPKFLSRSGDVLIPTSSSGGPVEEIATATCVMQDGVILGSDLLIYRTIKQIDGRVISYIIEHMLQTAITSVAQGKKIVHLKESDLIPIKVTIPTSQEEQRKIVECLGAIDDVIALSKAELEKWRELKKGLLQQLFV